MSGICGIVNLDGAPLERRVLEDMTSSLAFRGPDAHDIWVDGAVGMGHSLLRTTFESEHEHQPCSLDGQVWITADARIDGQAELRRKIAATGRMRSGGMAAGAPDVELILHAYHVWGADCLDHLLGDFTFAIWDGRSRQLFCARDHLGVKLFFFARVGNSLVFSNTLECVRRHPAVSGTLNELAIADFLLFEVSQDPGATAFADIQRLPPAQCLTVSDEGVTLRCYWTLSMDAEVRYRSAGDYVEHFRELLDGAVADRLRTRKVGVDMSGGLDSTAVAAVAKNVLSRQSESFELHANSLVHDHLMPSDERRFAEMAAHGLSIPIHCHVADTYRLYGQFDCPGLQFPGPVHEPDAAAGYHAMRDQATRGRVVLTGWDGDALLSESPKPYFLSLLKQGRILRLLSGIAGYAVSERRLFPRNVRSWLTGKTTVDAQHTPAYPTWLNPILEERLELRDRWEKVNAAECASHPVRPNAHRSFGHFAQWSNFLDSYDPGVTHVMLEYRHPLLDLRLLDYCLTLPPHPWCVKKKLLREAMRGVLPEPVRLRPKTPLAGWMGAYMLRVAESQWVDDFIPAPGLGAFVIRENIPRVWGAENSMDAWVNLRPLSLNYWLGSQQLPSQQSKGNSHGYA